jgi:16S rRNA (guanine966-N2)-methyltransferase
MRIIVGKFKGQKIEAPRGVLSRPPLAIIREAILNILGDSVVDARVLDLFAGSGSLGIEALSRGAGRAHFVDAAGRSAGMIDRNVRKLGLSAVCEVSRQDAVAFVRDWQGEPFDFVFVDPPFLSGKVSEVLAELRGAQVLPPKGLVVARSHWRESLELPAGLEVLKKRKFGESVVRFIARTEGGDSV